MCHKGAYAMSIIILMSTYNGEKYLSEQIDSLLSQTVKVEILVRDDGSTDSTQQILDGYAKRGMLKWYSGKNLGPGKSFFDLVQKASLADFYAFADQDDVWNVDKIHIAIEKIKTYPSDVPNLYCSAFTPVDSELNPIVVHKRLDRQYKISFAHALVENIAPGCTYVFNRTALEQFCKYKMEYITIHDWDLYRIVMALGGNIVYDEMSHILYRQHGNNTIGFQARNFHHWCERLKRFCMQKNQNFRYISACHIRECYYKTMPEQNREIISILTEYQDSLYKRLRFAKSTEFVMSHKVDTFILSILALVKRI